MKLTTLIQPVLKYLTSRETNYHERNLTNLYEDESKLLEKITEAHADPDISPSGDYIILLTSRLRETRNLIEAIEAKKVSR